jgi:hypothetical protein
MASEELLEDGFHIQPSLLDWTCNEDVSAERVPHGERLAAIVVEGAPPTLEVDGPEVVRSADGRGRRLRGDQRWRRLR